ncbi:hypothetical protein HYT53_05690 [Candidatus Woesearchaeota archaeon]|nr:hypothetical protein [Candidatus Woesearchaeota archaeon]
MPEKTITNSLEYKAGTDFDANDDGVEPTTGITDMTVENSAFTWDADETKLCTRWKVDSIEDAKSTTICYGSAKCCNFIDLEPSRDSWKGVFYSTYGQYGATLNNVVSSQIIYADYSLGIDEPFAEIYYSEWKELPAKYYFELIEFENVCIDTCILSGFNDTSYKLIFEIENAVLNLDFLTYSISEEISNVPVSLEVKDDTGEISGSYTLYRDNEPVQITEGFVEPDYYNIEVTPVQNVIDKLVIENANLTKPVTASIGIDNVSREIIIENVDAKKRYAINLEELEFEKAILTATASANSLWKCRQWDYDSEVCFGTWEKVKDLTPGQQYDVTLTANDPGFIEGDTNITIAPVNITNATINITGLALAKDIPNITIAINKNATIDLNEYFSNIDENTIFTYFGQEGISILFEGSTATIMPAENFTGTIYTYITAAKGSETAISNVFAVNIVNVTIDITPTIILEKKDFMLDEDVEIGFEYLTKQELIENTRWKEEYEVYEETTDKTEEELELLRGKISEEEKLLSEAEKAVKKQKKKWQKADDAIETFVYDNSGNLKDVDVEIEELREGKFGVKIPKPRSFKAGRYTLKLDLTKDGIAYSSQQDFTWGVLAINVNKSIYLPNEDSFIGIGVLDDAGRVVCNADVTLDIINPLNQKTTLTTANGDISISPECAYLGVTELPDYYTGYKVGGVGAYAMNLTAVTANGVRSISDNFTVQSSVAFDVARKGPTRVYPRALYTMKIPIIANQDYNGLVNEYVPSSFAITPQDGLSVAASGGTSILSWNVDMKQNDKIELSYEFDAPDTSPEFYLLGPLDIGNFKEARQWQIANDQAGEFNFTYPDAGAPGMNLVVHMVGTGFAPNDAVTTNSSGNITVGPIIVTDADGNYVTTNGRVLTTVFYIHPNATQQDVQVNVSGIRLPSVFKIISPVRDSGNFTGKTSGVFGIGDTKNGTRTARGTIVLDSLIIPAGVTVNISMSDTDSALPGIQGYFPVTIIVDGIVNISGTLNVSGSAGRDATGEGGGGGGHGGPGGGGGGAGGGDRATAGTMGSGGNGFTGGGGGGCESGTNCVRGGDGGNGTGTLGGIAANDGGAIGGNSTSPKVAGGGGSGVATTGGGGGGGTGFFFGSSGAGSGGAGGSGGGGGGAGGISHGGGGGFGISGADGATGTGGSGYGSIALIPIAGGSGGGGGGSNTAGGGGAGGGGGAVLIFSNQNITVMSTGQILADGGNGVNSANGDGGGGSGGGIVLQAANVSLEGTLSTNAGTAGGGSGGAGGLGRIRVDGLDNPVAQANFGFAGSNFTGVAIKNITDTSIGGTANASANIVVFVKNQTRGGASSVNTTFTGTADANGQFDIAVTWYTGKNFIAVMQNSTNDAYTVMSSAAVATYDFVVVPDNTLPRINASLNNSVPFQGEIVNMTANVSDNSGLSFCQFVDNQSLPNGAKNFFNKTVSGKNDRCSQNYTIALPIGSVINFTVIVNDTSTAVAGGGAGSSGYNIA